MHSLKYKKIKKFKYKKTKFSYFPFTENPIFENLVYSNFYKFKPFTTQVFHKRKWNLGNPLSEHQI